MSTSLTASSWSSDSSDESLIETTKLEVTDHVFEGLTSDSLHGMFSVFVVFRLVTNVQGY